MKRGEDFKIALRGKGRSSHEHLVVHCGSAGEDVRDSALVGFVIPKRVMPRAVDRNRTRRQLRHLLRAYVEQIPSQLNVVVRVRSNPHSPSFDWDKELGQCLKRAVKRAEAETSLAK